VAVIYTHRLGLLSRLLWGYSGNVTQPLLFEGDENQFNGKDYCFGHFPKSWSEILPDDDELRKMFYIFNTIFCLFF